MTVDYSESIFFDISELRSEKFRSDRSDSGRRTHTQYTKVRSTQQRRLAAAKP